MTFRHFIGVLSCLIAAAPLFAGDPPVGKAREKSPPPQNLGGRSFRGADLRHANLQRVDLRGADFTGAKMDRAELADADLSDAIGLGTVDFGLGIDAQRAIFRRADLRGARIPGTYFENADFRDADLRGAFLSGRFHGARFDGADVHGAVLLGAFGIESLRADLRGRGAIVSAADFVASVRAGRNYAECNLRSFELTKADLDGAPFERADLHSAHLEGASLRRARLAGARLPWAKLAAANFREADLTGTVLIGADLTGADLSQANCRGGNFGRARLIGAKLVGADLTNADLRQADLTGADLTGTTLDGVQWDAAILADLRGVTAEQEAELRSQAARWKHDLAEGFDGLVRNASVPAWMVVWPAGVIALVQARRRAPGHVALRLFIGLHAVAALPAFSLLFLIGAGVSPTAQLSGNLHGWSMWVGAWPLCFGATSLALVAFIPLTISAWLLARRPPAVPWKHLAAATALTGISLLTALGTLTQLAPTA